MTVFSPRMHNSAPAQNAGPRLRPAQTASTREQFGPAVLNLAVIFKLPFSLNVPA